MRYVPCRLALMTAVAAVVVVAACRSQENPPQVSNGGSNGRKAADQPKPASIKETLGSRFGEFLAAHQSGLGHMERYEYGQAVADFRRAVALAPDYDVPKVNLAIALLNDTGVKTEESKKGGGAPTSSTANFNEALELLDGVLERDPKNLTARYSRGVILEYLGRIQEAHQAYKAVVEADPTDAHAWVGYGSTLPDPERPNFQASLKQADQLVEIYTKALEANPYLVTAMFKLYGAYNWAAVSRSDAEGKAAAKAESKKLFELWNRLNPDNNVAGPGDPGKQTYGQMGKYCTVIDPFPAGRDYAAELTAPRFSPPEPIRVDLPAGHRWSQAADFNDVPAKSLGLARDRFGAAAATLDADRDGTLDLYLAGAAIGPEGVRDVLLLNQGDGRFADVSAEWNLPAGVASLAVAAGDFDADGFVDLCLTGIGPVRLLRNEGGNGFADVTSILGDEPPTGLCPAARWLDLDQDGDLDLVIARYTAAEAADRAFGDEPPPGAPNLLYRNDGTPPNIPNTVPKNLAPAAVVTEDRETDQGLTLKLVPWTGDEVAPIAGGDDRHTGIASIDLDEDRDIDLILTADGGPPRVALNDRLGRFTAATLDDLNAGGGPVNGAVPIHLDHDDRTDVVIVTSAGRLGAWRNREATGEGGRPSYHLENWATDARTWRLGIAADVDLDGWMDLLGVPEAGASEAPAALWSRNEGNRLATRALALGPDSDATLLGLAWADLAGDALPDLLLVRDGEPPRLSRNLGNGNHWLALDLSGRWKFGFDFMRTNPHGLGTKLAIEAPGLDVPYAYHPEQSGPSQSVGPVVLGLGETSEASLVRLRWPDGVMQAELNVPADQTLDLVEYNRKTGSCPVLFTFNGRTYTCIGDFLGGGGLGYLVAPGEYGQPDRDEAVAIAPDQLRAVNGQFLLSITEPMDELAYLDKLTLEVVDRPPGVQAAPDERFAPGGNRPTGELIAWREEIEPAGATDLAGRDVSEKLRAWDRDTVDDFNRLRGWIGYAEEHGIVLNFGDRLSKFGPNDRLVLCLAGWVEYPYSQTNYAAASAGVPLQPPVLERQEPDGTWETLESDPGYPAGMPRMTTLDLTGKFAGDHCVLRLKTNMECYWDRAFVAVAASDAGLVTSTLPVAKATLGYRGYTREYSPDGRLPLLYDYEHVDPAPLARLAGRLTRYGDVLPLLTEDDDQFCLVGPGDEAKLQFDASGLPELPEGWTRSYVLRAIGYCKDTDPFTATSDTVGPLPYRGMPPYPFGAEGERPADREHEAYLRQYQTREVRR